MKTLTFCFILFCTLFFSDKSFSQIDSSWSKRYSGTQNGDEARSMLLDASNNVYVTKRSLSATNGYDIVTVKYNSFGVVLWTAVYNGTGNSTDEGNNIGFDGTNIYVTGVTTRTPSTGLDYVTIKYNASTGDVLWTSIFNGVGNVDDIATKLAIKNNSVYVTGKGYYRNSTDDDYVTIKYKASTGDSILVKTYNGPGNGNDSATYHSMLMCFQDIYTKVFSRKSQNNCHSESGKICIQNNISAHQCFLLLNTLNNMFSLS